MKASRSMPFIQSLVEPKGIFFNMPLCLDKLIKTYCLDDLKFEEYDIGGPHIGESYKKYKFIIFYRGTTDTFYIDKNTPEDFVYDNLVSYIIDYKARVISEIAKTSLSKMGYAKLFSDEGSVDTIPSPYPDLSEIRSKLTEPENIESVVKILPYFIDKSWRIEVNIDDSVIKIMSDRGTFRLDKAKFVDVLIQLGIFKGE